MSRKFIPSLVLALAFNVAASNDAQAQKSRQSALVVEADTGKVLHEVTPDKKVHPASLTKLMTLYLIFEGIEKKTLQLDQKMVAARDMEESRMRISLHLQKGQEITVEEAILGLIVHSANDVAIVAAEHIGGTQESFVAMMNDRAKTLGMSATHFTNPSGMPDPKQVTTARDMVTLEQALFRDFPQYLKYFEKKSFTFRKKTYQAHSTLMDEMPEADFGKTGFINASGFNLAASARRGDKRVFAAIFGETSAAARDKSMAKLLDAGLDQVIPKKPAP